MVHWKPLHRTRCSEVSVESRAPEGIFPPILTHPPVAPTEFPTGWAAAREVGSPRGLSFCAPYIPQEEETLH